MVEYQTIMLGGEGRPVRHGFQRRLRVPLRLVGYSYGTEPRHSMAVVRLQAPHTQGTLRLDSLSWQTWFGAPSDHTPLTNSRNGSFQRPSLPPNRPIDHWIVPCQSFCGPANQAGPRGRGYQWLLPIFSSHFSGFARPSQAFGERPRSGLSSTTWHQILCSISRDSRNSERRLSLLQQSYRVSARSDPRSK